VQPVLTKYCSALACHGHAQRFFRVLARNRARLNDNETLRNAFMTAEERAHNYAAAIAVIDASDPDRSELLLKPLEESVGGRFHVGATLYGKGNVFPPPTMPIIRSSHNGWPMPPRSHSAAGQRQLVGALTMLPGIAFAITTVRPTTARQVQAAAAAFLCRFDAGAVGIAAHVTSAARRLQLIVTSQPSELVDQLRTSRRRTDHRRDGRGRRPSSSGYPHALELQRDGGQRGRRRRAPA
jgi:hypothetical protein